MAGTSESTHKTVNLALCGFGRAGHMHIASIRRSNRCRLRYIVDVAGTQDTIQKFLEEWDMTSTKFVSAADFDTVVLQDRELQAVMITTTTCVHEQYVRKSLRAGKAVFCEKPIAATIEATKACYKEASDAGLPLLCAFNRRFDPGFKRVYKQVREGKIGKVHMIKTTSRDSPLPPMDYLRQSNGMFHDCAVHDLDVMCWILGETPVEVYAQGTAQHPEIAAMNDVDTIAIVLKFPSGTLATIDLSRHSSYGYDQRLEVLGEKGMISLNNVPDDTVVSSGPAGFTSSALVHSFPTRYKEAYYQELEHFLDVVLDSTQTLCVQEQDTVRCSSLAVACEESCKTKKVQKLSIKC